MENGNGNGKGHAYGLINQSDNQQNVVINDKIEDLIISFKTNNAKFNQDINSNANYLNDRLGLNERSSLNNFSLKLRNFLVEIIDVKKNIRILNEDERFKYKNEYIDFKNNIDLLEGDNFKFTNSIDRDEKSLIIEQNKRIGESIENLQKNLSFIDKNFDEIGSNEELFNRTIVIEKEIKNINRQYRAIEWILFEQ